MVLVVVLMDTMFGHWIKGQEQVDQGSLLEGSPSAGVVVQLLVQVSMLAPEISRLPTDARKEQDARIPDREAPSAVRHQCGAVLLMDGGVRLSRLVASRMRVSVRQLQSVLSVTCACVRSMNLREEFAVELDADLMAGVFGRTHPPVR